MKSIVYVTTATSGSASITRVIDALIAPPYKPLVEPAMSNGPAKVEDFEATGHSYLVRGVATVSAPIYDPRFRYIVNFRDPRDMFCNQYHWLVQHVPGGPKDQNEAQRRARYELGIDASVLGHKSPKELSFVLDMQDAASAGADVLFISYAQLCCAFDRMLERVIEFLGVTPSDAALERISLERPENLAKNPNWIGQTWVGTDVMPGRYRQDLKPETIAILNERFGPTIERLKSLEFPELRHLYD